MKPRLVSLIGGVILFLVTVIGFFWLWSQTKVAAERVSSAENLKPVEIETVKDQAKELLAGKENNANLPLSLPLEKIGRTNPFVSP